MAKIKHIYSAMLSAVFLTFLLVPLVIFLFGAPQEKSEIEKRKLAVFPEFEISLEGISAFSKMFDTYFNDHFGLRDSLIKMYDTIFLQLFNVSPSNYVFKGKDGWFFYTAEGVLEDFYGQQHKNMVSLDKAASTLIDRRDWLNSIGVRYLFVPVPNKIGNYSSEKSLQRYRDRSSTVVYL